MRVLGSLRAVPGALWTRGTAVDVPIPESIAGGGFRRTEFPRLEPVHVSATAHPDGLRLRVAMGHAEPEVTGQTDVVGFELGAGLGSVSASGASAAAPFGVSKRLELGTATAVAVVVESPQRVRPAVASVVYVPASRRRDPIDRAWTDLQSQREEDELLELLGVFD